MKKINKEDIKVGYEVWVKAKVGIFNKDLFLVHDWFDDAYEEDDWIPFNEEDFLSLNKHVYVLVQYRDGSVVAGKSDRFKKFYGFGDIIAYKIITPYKPSRRKVVVKDCIELHKLILEHGPLYCSETSEEYICFKDGSFVKHVEEWGVLVVYPFDDWDEEEWWVE